MMHILKTILILATLVELGAAGKACENKETVKMILAIGYSIVFAILGLATSL